MKRILAVLLAVMLLAAVIPTMSLAEEGNVSNYDYYKVYRVHTNGGHLMLRSGPGTNYRVIDSLRYGKPLKYLSCSGGWYKVRTFHGTTGWVSSRYVKRGAYCDVCTRTSGLNYRTGPGTGYGIKGSWARGTRDLLATRVSGNWAYVEKHGRCGWSSMTYLEWSY